MKMNSIKKRLLIGTLILFSAIGAVLGVVAAIAVMQRLV